jgi:tetratricopeptide (TPR) repeat protein
VQAQAATLVADAEEAVRLAHADPGRARALARSVIPRARATGDHGAAATAERALGQIATGLEDLPLAASHLGRSLRLATRARDRVREAEARMSLALVLAHQGHARRALRELDRAAPVLRGRDAGRLLNQRATVLNHLGRLDEALADYERGLAISRRVGDELGEARILCNRGVAYTYRGAHEAAVRDLRRAEILACRLDQRLLVAGIHQNLGWLADRRGDLPEALAWYDRAEREYRPHCEPLGTLLLDRCHLLLAGRLLAEAAEAAEAAIDACERGGLDTTLAEARLALAEVALQAGDPAAARTAAATAADSLRRQRRPAWAALARYTELRASLAAERRGEALGPVAPTSTPAGGVGGPAAARDPARRRAALRLAHQLERAGWADAAADVRIVAARLALDAGRPRVARRELAACASARRRGTVETRTRAWHAEALLRLAEGDRRGARSALHTGLRILEQHRAALGATDLRAATSAHQVELARLAVGMAIADGRAAEALAWTERTRSSLLRFRLVRPADDGVLAADLAALRSTVTDVEEAIREGRPSGPLLRRQAALERAVRDRCRRAAADPLACSSAPPPPRALAARLGPRALVEYVALDGELYALSVVAGQPRLHRLGPLPPVLADVERQLFMLRRLAAGGGGAASQQAAVTAVRGLGARLDGRLLVPLAPVLGDRPLVVVPTGALQALPFSTLPTCWGRPTSIAPSATGWYQAAARSAPGTRSAFVAGPGLPGATGEARAVARIHATGTLLTGRAARAADVLAALDGARLVHLAAHGRLRADNPLFTSLELADGPLTVYDLERLSRAPLQVVLSACDVGRPEVRPGDEVLGLAAALLALGSQTLIASVISLPDAEVAPVMIALHRQLAAGVGPAEALARVQRAYDGADPAMLAASAGLVCLGAG